jgi:ectoine hydroxylase-related dioxygenase (phytanoyl-CoA dioxygenase family)
MQADPHFVEAIEREGYAVIPDALDAGRIARLKVELEAAIAADLAVYEQEEARTGRPHVDRFMVHNAMLRGVELARILEHELMHAYLSHFLGDTCILYAYQTSSLPAHGTNYSNRIHVDSPRLVPGYPTNMAVFFPLDDLTEDNGATYVLPGSHVLAEAPSEAKFDAGAVRLTCPAGSMIVLNSRVWHRGGINRTSQTRHMLTLAVCRSYMRTRFDFPRLIEKTQSNVLDVVGPVGRRFLGYNVRVPTSLEVYYLPENERLYLPNQG